MTGTMVSEQACEKRKGGGRGRHTKCKHYYNTIIPLLFLVRLAFYNNNNNFNTQSPRIIPTHVRTTKRSSSSLSTLPYPLFTAA